MMTLDQQFEAACKALEIPGAVLVAGDVSGMGFSIGLGGEVKPEAVRSSFHYEKAFGVCSLKPGDTVSPLTTNALFFTASCTKLVTAIAALQCVERGRFTLDEDVTRFLPELKDIKILKGFDKETKQSILAKATNKITLRQLLSHTSGFGYDIFEPTLMKWRKSLGKEDRSKRRSMLYRITTPLLFEPGEGFMYSTGFDWAGIMIERANNMSLGQYMKMNIFEPLGITSMTFHPEKELPDLSASIPQMSKRQGGLNVFGTPKDPSAPVTWNPEKTWAPLENDDAGGAGLYARATDYLKILQSIISPTTPLLSQTSVNQLFKPQLPPPSQESLAGILQFKELNDSMGLSLPMGTKLDHGLGGMICLQDMEGRRRKGTMFWSGLPNLMWWADRKAGVCGFYASQLVPTGDPRSIELFEVFERDVYSMFGKGVRAVMEKL